MLHSGPNRHADLSTAISSIHNYYEHLVIDRLQAVLQEKFSNHDYIADIACVALNHLPPQYIRHDVDMAFYLPSDKRQEISANVEKAVDDAIEFVDNSDKQYEVT